MSTTLALEQTDDVASRVLRRAHVSKMTRALQSRLALANVKIQNGWENLSFEAIEPKMEERYPRKRPASSNDTTSDTASTASSRLHSSAGLASSPLTDPLFSDELSRSIGSIRKRRIVPTQSARVVSSGGIPNRRTRTSTRQSSDSWRKDRFVSQSSPIKPLATIRHARFPSTQLSFISETSTIPDSVSSGDPPSPDFSEPDSTDLPVTSFSINASTRITSSPPQTPPPDRRMRIKRDHNSISWSRTPKTGEEGADLLMYLAASPSPANARDHTTEQARPQHQQQQQHLVPPSTPPCKSTPLPSSHMTPGMIGSNGFLAFGPNTPGTSNFNFADFVNVTPSPAQGPWNRTPVAAARTPARRRLNFDTLVPPSPQVRSGGRGSVDGLGMEFGDLVS